MIGIYKCMVTKDHIQIKGLLRHENTKAVHSVPKEGEKYLGEIGIMDNIDDHLKTATQEAKKLKEKYKRGYI